VVHKGASLTPAVLLGDHQKDIHGTNAYKKVPDHAREISRKVIKKLNNIWNEIFAKNFADFSAALAQERGVLMAM